MTTLEIKPLLPIFAAMEDEDFDDDLEGDEEGDLEEFEELDEEDMF